VRQSLLRSIIFSKKAILEKDGVGARDSNSRFPDKSSGTQSQGIPRGLVRMALRRRGRGGAQQVFVRPLHVVGSASLPRRRRAPRAPGGREEARAFVVSASWALPLGGGEPESRGSSIARHPASPSRPWTRLTGPTVKSGRLSLEFEYRGTALPRGRRDFFYLHFLGRDIPFLNTWLPSHNQQGSGLSHALDK
jgi:hypothetical protein